MNKHDKWAEKNGFENYIDYRNKLSKEKGFKSYNDYRNHLRNNKAWEEGKQLPYSENEKCTLYLGIYIAENILPTIFENPQRMPFGNPGYDFVCKNGYKIDVKSSCLHANNKFYFNIDNNNIADYFIMLGFDDRENLNLIHIWLIKGTELIKRRSTPLRRINTFKKVVILNTEKGLYDFKNYEMTHDLEKIRKICNSFKTIKSGDSIGKSDSRNKRNS